MIGRATETLRQSFFSPQHIDRWNDTPLDDTIREKEKAAAENKYDKRIRCAEVETYLREKGAKKSKELAG